MRHKYLIWVYFEKDRVSIRLNLICIDLIGSRPSQDMFLSREYGKGFKYFNYTYFNVRKFREFRELNGREKYLLTDSRILISTKHSFQIFLVIFCLLEHKNRLFTTFYQCFCLGKLNFAKINPCEMN